MQGVGLSRYTLDCCHREKGYANRLERRPTPRSRREVLIAGMGGIAMLAGCSVLSDPQQSLRATVLNYTEPPHQFHLVIEDGGTELVRQYLEVPASDGDDGRTRRASSREQRLPSSARNRAPT